MRFRLPLITVLTLFLAVQTSPAAVLDKAAGGFTVEIELAIAAAPTKTYNTFVNDIGVWWHPDHTFSGSAANLSFDPVPGGCFCEKLEGGSLRHLEVIYADAGKELRLSGGLGPLHELGVAGAMKLEFSGDKHTVLKLTYRVGGYLPNGLDSWAEAVDFVLNEQLSRLKKQLEHGSTDTP